MIAVISADIIGYTKLEQARAEEVLAGLTAFFDEIGGRQIKSNIGIDFKIRRGDSIQGEIKNPVHALRIAIMLKAVVTQIKFGKINKRKHPEIDIRLAIGIGSLDISREKIDVSVGSAYTNSGRTLDQMKQEKRIFAIKTENQQLNEEFETEFKLLEVILSSWNITSAELVYWLLKDLTEVEIAEQLGVSQSAVNQRKKRAGWSGIEALIERYEKLMARIQ
ncbi:MAG: hypothetical protein GQ574_24185 [Crocinitomix sp.]|nr:hypothetical protein [Crocinitomix sp.]